MGTWASMMKRGVMKRTAFTTGPVMVSRIL
jgi:hypothetical protein